MYGVEKLHKKSAIYKLECLTNEGLFVAHVINIL